MQQLEKQLKADEVRIWVLACLSFASAFCLYLTLEVHVSSLVCVGNAVQHQL